MIVCELRKLLEKQIQDAALWIAPLQTGDVVHAYLQQELRKLHAAVEAHLEICEVVDKTRG